VEHLGCVDEVISFRNANFPKYFLAAMGKAFSLVYTSFVEFLQSDMRAMVNSTESRSEADDLFETIDALHHRAVTKLQLEYHDKEESCLAQAPEWIEQYAVVNGIVSKGYACKSISDNIDLYLKAEHSKMEDAIRAFEKLRIFMKQRVIDTLPLESIDSPSLPK